MIQALNIPYSSKTDEIMSRYRPIAPKPEFPASNSSTNNNANNNNNYDVPLVPEKFRQSPYLRNIWSHLQARPTRTRKRGGRSSSGISPAAAAALLRKQQHHQQQQHQQQQHEQTNMVTASPTFMGLCSPSQAFARLYIDPNNTTNNSNNSNNSNNVVELPLLSCPMLSHETVDLNKVAVETTVLEERDLLLQLQVPSCSSGGRSGGSGGGNGNVISPRPVRPVGSSISIVGQISEDYESQVVVKAPEEVEAAAEAELLPSIISDRNNKVRMVNSAYKELVGQPECVWLDSMCSGGRISGEVMLQLSKYSSGLPVSSNGFSCWVRIEWESDGKKISMNAFCEVARLACLSKDYLFSWRFHTREVSPSASKVV